VGIATGYELDDQAVGVQVPVRVRIFTSPRLPDRLCGPTSYPMGTGGCFPGDEAAGV
jgi:hypothetical protein